MSYSHARAYAHTHALPVVPAPVTLQLSPRHQSQTETKSTEVFFVQFYGRDVLRDFLVGNKKTNNCQFQNRFCLFVTKQDVVKRGDSNCGVIWRSLLCSFWLIYSHFGLHFLGEKVFTFIWRVENFFLGCHKQRSCRSF